MECPENRAIAAFDTLYTTDHIRILKILLPFVDGSARRDLTVLIKFLELKYTMELLRRTPALSTAEVCGLTSGGPEGGAGNGAGIAELFAQIRMFCTPTERAAIEQLAGLQRSMELYERMMGMMQLFSGTGGEADSAASGDAPDPMELLKGMLSPEQQTIFEMFLAEEPR